MRPWHLRVAYRGDRGIEVDAVDAGAGREGAEQSRRDGGADEDERAAVVGATDQPPEGLRQPPAGNEVVVGAAAESGAAGGMDDGRARPRHALHDDEAQRLAGHVDAVPQRVGAQQRSSWFGTENIDQRAGVDRVDVLGEEGQAGPCQRVGDAGVDRLQPADCGEQAERPAVGGFDQAAVSHCQCCQILPFDVGYDQHAGVGGIVERAVDGEAVRRQREVTDPGTERGTLPVLPRPRVPRAAGRRRPQRGPAAERRRRDHDRVRGFEYRLGQRPGRVEPAAVDADVVLAALDAVDGEPVDEVGVGRAAEPREQPDPAPEQLPAQPQPRRRALDARPARPVEPVGRDRRAPRRAAPPVPRAAGRAPRAPPPRPAPRRRRRGEARRPRFRGRNPYRRPRRRCRPSPFHSPARRPAPAPPRAAPRPARRASRRRAAGPSRRPAAPARRGSRPRAPWPPHRRSRRGPTAAPRGRAAGRARSSRGRGSSGGPRSPRPRSGRRRRSSRRRRTGGDPRRRRCGSARCPRRGRGPR